MSIMGFSEYMLELCVKTQTRLTDQCCGLSETKMDASMSKIALKERQKLAEDVPEAQCFSYLDRDA